MSEGEKLLLGARAPFLTRPEKSSQSHVVHGHRLTKRRNAARHEEEDWLWDALRLQRVVGEVGKEGEKGGR